jgi:hypothetical protein
MLTEDYFMRMINQMLVVLTQILFHKEAGQYQEAQVLINQSLEELLGVPPKLLKQMDDTSLLHLLTTQGELDPDRLAMIAELYNLEGDLLSDESVGQEAAFDYLRSLTLFLEISLAGKDQGISDVDAMISNLENKLAGQKLPIETRYLLFEHYEKQGAHLQAEKQVTYLLKEGDQLNEYLPGIIDYYVSKLELTDGELLTSGVTRQQLIEKLNSLLKLAGEHE